MWRCISHAAWRPDWPPKLTDKERFWKSLGAAKAAPYVSLPSDEHALTWVQTQLADDSRAPTIRRIKDFDPEASRTEAFRVIRAVDPDVIILTEAPLTFPGVGDRRVLYGRLKR